MVRSSYCGRCGVPVGDGGACPRCLIGAALTPSGASGAGPSQPSRLLPRLGGYDLVQELGRGGMGVVYRALDSALGREVALKVLSAPLKGAAQVRFEREGEALARLRHPNVVRVHSMGSEGGLRYLVLDLVTGGSLGERLERGGPLPPREAARQAAALARGLAHAHAQGILHRDLKPANVLFTGEGEPVLTDFGLARLEDSEAQLSRSGAIIGTPGFLAPEQASGRRDQIGPATDVYGLGATLYAMLSGVPPVQGTEMAEVIGRTLHMPPPPLSEHGVQVDPDLERIVARCLAKAPEARYPSADALAAALEDHLAGRSPAAGFDPQRAVRVLTVLAAVVVLAAAGLVVWRAARRAPDVAALGPPPAAAPEPPPDDPRPERPGREGAAPSWPRRLVHGGGSDVLVLWREPGQLLSLGADGQLVRWEQGERRQAAKLMPEPAVHGELRALLPLPGRAVLGVGGRGQVRGSDGVCRLDLPFAITAATLAPDARALYLSREDGAIYAQELPQGALTLLHPAEPRVGGAYALELTPDGGELIAAMRAMVDDAQESSFLLRLRLPEGREVGRLGLGRLKARRLALAPASLGPWLVVGFSSGHVQAFQRTGDGFAGGQVFADPEDGDYLGAAHGGGTDAVAFSRDGRRVLTAGDGRRDPSSGGADGLCLRAWSWPDGRRVADVRLPARAYALAEDPAGGRVAVGTWDGDVELVSLGP